MPHPKSFVSTFVAFCLWGAAAVPAGATQGNTCVVWMRMTSPASVASIDFLVDYARADGSFQGEGRDVVCARALPGTALAAFRDLDADGQRRLSVGIARVNEFTGPLDLAACRWLFNDAAPVPGDFDVFVTGAGNSHGDDLSPPYPRVRVDRVQCPGQLPDGLSTTTTTTTTVFVSTTSSSTSTTLVGGFRCGFPATNGAQPTASDALFALGAAVGIRECDECICDVDGSGAVAASDALAILARAVGQGPGLDCPPCA